MSVIYKGSKKILGGGIGSVAESTNSKQLNNINGSNYIRKWYLMSQKTGTTYYKIGTLNETNSGMNVDAIVIQGTIGMTAGVNKMSFWVSICNRGGLKIKGWRTDPTVISNNSDIGVNQSGEIFFIAKQQYANIQVEMFNPYGSVSLNLVESTPKDTNFTLISNTADVITLK